MKTFKDINHWMYWRCCWAFKQILPLSKGPNSVLIFCQEQDSYWEPSKWISEVLIPVKENIVFYGDPKFLETVEATMDAFIASYAAQYFLHCEEGPAVIYYSNKRKTETYYINGKEIGKNLNIYSAEQLQNYLVLE